MSVNVVNLKTLMNAHQIINKITFYSRTIYRLLECLLKTINSVPETTLFCFSFSFPLLHVYKTTEQQLVIFRSQAKHQHQTMMSSLKAALAKLMKQGIHRLIEESRKPCAWQHRNLQISSANTYTSRLGQVGWVIYTTWCEDLVFMESSWRDIDALSGI